MAIDTKGAAWSEHSTLYALPTALLGGTAPSQTGTIVGAVAGFVTGVTVMSK